MYMVCEVSQPDVDRDDAMAPDVDLLKEALSTFASGVTVVTTTIDGRLHGMTANAFSSVSLDPPLVLVCVDQSARIHEYIHHSGVFAVNVLSEGQQRLSDHFARRGRPLEGEFDHAPYTIGHTGAPLLTGACAFVECTLHRAYAGGDHTIYVGRVEATGAYPDRRPLVYHRRRYVQWSDDGTLTPHASR